MKRLCLVLIVAAALGAEPLFESRFVFPLEHWHNHSSSIAQLSDGSFLLVWFHGSGERRADDVRVLGSRLPVGAEEWTPPFVVADYPGFPDTNCVLFRDQQDRLWLFWMTFIANEVNTTIVHYRVSTDYLQPAGPPRWERQEVLLLKPDLYGLRQKVEKLTASALPNADAERAAYLNRLRAAAADKFTSRMGWMVRSHPLQLPSGRILLPLYSDVYDFSLVALSDDEGATWRAARPIVGFGAVQPSLVRREDGRIVAFMRDNGPPPKRMLIASSADDGERWTAAEDSDIPNPGSSVEVVKLASGEWLLVYNDVEQGRHSLAAALSDDEGETWRWKRRIERDDRGEGAGSFHYPSVVQAEDGTIHVTYSYFLNHLPDNTNRKTIKHVRFNTEWIKESR